MQKGSLIRSSRRQGPDVWEYRWRESCSGQRKKHRRIVIGALNTLKDESAVLKAIAAGGVLFLASTPSARLKKTTPNPRKNESQADKRDQTENKLERI
jgi:hypothetical protein